MNLDTGAVSELETQMLRGIDDGHMVDLLQKLFRIPSVAPPRQLREIVSFVPEAE